MAPDKNFTCAEKSLDAANYAADVSRNVYIVFLLVGAYIGVGVAGTSDEQLLRVSAATLPLLNVQVPITGFYRFVPWGLVLLHLNLLLQLALLARKLHVFDARAGKTRPDEENALRERLNTFPFAQMLIGPQQGGIMRLVQLLIVWITIIVLPLGLLLWVQFGYLPYHDSDVLWEHLATICVDALILILFLYMIESHPIDKWTRRWRTHFSGGMVVLTITALVAISASILTMVKTPPAEQGDVGEPAFFVFSIDNKLEIVEKVLTANELSAELVNALKGDDSATEEMLKKVLGLELQGRDLRSANLSYSVLPKVNLHQAKLIGVDLSYARLPEANLVGAKLEGATLTGAQLQRADLTGAFLQGAYLTNARLLNAKLNDAKLHGTDLHHADLSGAHLIGATIENADLDNATLNWAILKYATLRDVKLRSAKLIGADLGDTVLEEIHLEGAILNGAKGLTQHQLEGACGDEKTKLPPGLSIKPCRDDQEREDQI